MPRLSVIIVTYKRPHLAQRLAENIHKILPDVEIILVDQENTAAVKHHGPFFQYINLPKGNISKARNAGLEKATGDVVLYLDDDVEVTSETISAHLIAYESDDVVAVAGRVINDDDKLPGDTDVETGKTNWLATTFIQNYWSTKRQFVDFPYGCNMSFRKKVLKEIGGFDERFDRIFDDIDIGYRISKKGKIAFEPKALVYHHKAPHGGTRVDGIGKNKLLYLNYGKYIAKNVSFPFSVATLLLRTFTALREAPYAVSDLWGGYMSGI